MIQFNLLPDVKLEYIKATYRKRLIIAVSVTASIVSLIIFVILLLFVRVNQVHYMKALTGDINTSVKELESISDLDKILTIQNQLDSLPALHDKKVVSSRMFDYLGQLVPANSTVSDVVIDFEASKITIAGSSDSLANVNKFVDTLKFTKYSTNETTPREKEAFNSVVLSNFSIPKDVPGTSTKSKVTYGVSFLFDPVIFSTIKDLKNKDQPAIALKVPSIISTRSETEKPNLFAPQTENKQGSEQ